MVGCAQVRPRAGEDTEDIARRLAKELHAQAFAPRLDLTQSDIRSLDGSPTAGGGRSSERLKSCKDNWLGGRSDYRIGSHSRV